MHIKFPEVLLFLQILVNPRITHILEAIIGQVFF